MSELQVQAGEEAALWTGYSYGHYSIVNVQRVTPGGQRVLENGHKYDKEGLRIGHESTPTRLYDLTNEIRATIRRETRVKYLTSFPWDRMSNEFLDEVMAFMHDHGFDAVQ